ncbi:MAG: hypothetical protein ACXW0T_10740 [Methylobacter sp.]
MIGHFVHRSAQGLGFEALIVHPAHEDGIALMQQLGFMAHPWHE